MTDERLKELADKIGENISASLDPSRPFSTTVIIFGLFVSIVIYEKSGQYAAHIVQIKPTPNHQIFTQLFPTVFDLLKEIQTLHVESGFIELARNKKIREMVNEFVEFGWPQKVEEEVRTLSLENKYLSSDEEDGEEEDGDEKNEETAVKYYPPIKRTKIEGSSAEGSSAPLEPHGAPRALI